MRGTEGMTSEQVEAKWQRQRDRCLARATCQACGEPTTYGDPVIRVTYGKLHITAHPRLRVDRPTGVEDDYFHARCAAAVAIRDVGHTDEPSEVKP